MLSFLRLIMTLNLIFLPFLSEAQDLLHKININTADVATLDQALEGIGEKKAQAIVEYREKHGPFKSIYDLAHVTGIGEKTIDRNKNRIEVLPPEEKNVVSGEDNSAEKSAPSTGKSSQPQDGKSKSSPESPSKIEEDKELPKK